MAYRNGNRIRKVAFVDQSLHKAYLELNSGRFEEKQLFENIGAAIDELKDNPFVGVAIRKSLWPKEYVRKFGINNLRKYDLPDGWRLIYTLSGNKVEILSVILEWFNHKEYERRFGY